MGAQTTSVKDGLQGSLIPLGNLPSHIDVGADRVTEPVLGSAGFLIAPAGLQVF